MAKVPGKDQLLDGICTAYVCDPVAFVLLVLGAVFVLTPVIFGIVRWAFKSRFDGMKEQIVGVKEQISACGQQNAVLLARVDLWRERLEVTEEKLTEARAATDQAHELVEHEHPQDETVLNLLTATSANVSAAIGQVQNVRSGIVLPPGGPWRIVTPDMPLEGKSGDGSD